MTDHEDKRAKVLGNLVDGICRKERDARGGLDIDATVEVLFDAYSRRKSVRELEPLLIRLAFRRMVSDWRHHNNTAAKQAADNGSPFDDIEIIGLASAGARKILNRMLEDWMIGNKSLRHVTREELLADANDARAKAAGFLERHQFEARVADGMEDGQTVGEVWTEGDLRKIWREVSGAEQRQQDVAAGGAG